DPHSADRARRRARRRRGVRRVSGAPALAPDEKPARRLEEGSPAASKLERSVLVALVGRPNSGKSSLYNAVTGGDAHVGNFPGITVDVLEAEVALSRAGHATVADLPGLYSIDAVVDASTDEEVARAFLDRARDAGRAVVVAQVIDATQLALGLRLTRELV